MIATFDHAQDEASNITTFWFKPASPIDYTAGQYIELTLKHDNPDDRGEKRWFTLSSAPENDLVSITTKFSDPGSSFKQALKQLKAGQTLEMSEAMGDFVLPKFVTQPLVFVAGGIGLTPFHSMFGWLNAHHEQRHISFIYAVKNEDQIIFQDTWQHADIHSTVIVDEPSDAWGGERGQLSSELILGLTKPSDDTLFYISGPEPLIEKLGNDLHKSGIKNNQLVTDFFPGYTTF
jgi:ferredoxin-NADP reductase